METDNLQCEVTILPLEVTNSDEIINNSLKTLAKYEISYEIGPISTTLNGKPDQLWSALRQMYEEAVRQGREVMMVAKVTNG
ncbi:MAG: thiamine-binding protein [Limnochordales bacterium]|nr:thiamine-binding protein [Limnochordales bacterium]